MRENTDQKNSEHGHFLRSEYCVSSWSCSKFCIYTSTTRKAFRKVEVHRNLAWKHLCGAWRLAILLKDFSTIVFRWILQKLYKHVHKKTPCDYLMSVTSQIWDQKFGGWPKQCPIQEKFGDNVFSWRSGLLSSIPAKVYWFILFYTLLATFFSCIRCSYEQNERKLIVYFRNLSDNNDFLFLFFIFGDIFLGAHNVWTLQFSV